MAPKDNTAEKPQPAAGANAQARELIAAKNYSAARELLLQSLKTAKTAETYCDLGEACALLGNVSEATINFEAAVKTDPRYHRAYACLGELLLTQGHVLHALDYYAMAIKHGPDEARYVTLFLTLAMHLRIQSFNKDLKELLTGFFRRSDVDISNASFVWLSLLWKDPLFKDIVKTLKKGGADMYPALQKSFGKNRKALLDPYFLLGLRNLIVASVDFENLLTALRRFVLEEYTAGGKTLSGGDLLAVARALSYNALLTDYIFDATAQETEAVQALRAKAESGDADETRLAVLGCYAPLAGLENAAEIAAKLKTAPGRDTREFAFIHIEDYLDQKRIRPTIPAIAEIRETTSAKVREQYEESPYPRWMGYSSVIYNEKAEGFLRNGAPRILNAGCGTGREAIELASVFPNAAILAVDLSLTSLSYGAKRARDIGLENIEFRQGDILGMGVLSDKFDFIASSGVLHHMKDPAAGLAVLNGLLKPGGIMRLALYSETARRHIAKARESIKDNNFAATAADIRRFRREAPVILPKETYDNICSFRDYFVLPECRDLLFHVQEHRFTIPQLKDFLSAEGLEFRGLQIYPHVMAQYGKAYPDDPDGLNLDNWHAFEQENPDTFREMYRFWCGKNAL